MVRLSGRDVLLPGPYDSPESRAAYDRFIAEWLINGRRVPDRPSPSDGPNVGPLVDELIDRYIAFARTHYLQRGTETSEVGNIQDALRPFHDAFGPTYARDFGPKSLKQWRALLIDRGLSRPGINARVGRVVRMFKWAASEELIPADVYHALRTVSGLQRGRTPARETEPVRPVPDAWVDAIRPHVSVTVWAMIELSRLTGMRPNEVINMRTRDIDVSGRVWIYRPPHHKMSYRGRDRSIYLGPRAQAILREWLKPQLDEPIFSPSEAEASRKAAMRAARKTKVQPSQVDRSKPDAQRKPRDRFETRTYANAIRRACNAAGVPTWSPNRLRHSVATRIRKSFGLDASQVILGHASADTTQIYAELDHQRAAAIMLEVG